MDQPMPVGEPSADSEPSGASIRAPAPHQNIYDDGGSERRAIGSITVRRCMGWEATLTVPIDTSHRVYLTLERFGEAVKSYGEADNDSAELWMSDGDVDAVLALLSGVVAQARRDGVLPSAPV